MKKRGVLFTIGLAFYCAGLLTLVLVFIDHTEKVRATGNDAGGLSQVDSMYNSIERSVQKVFETSSGIGLEIEGGTITITEELPNPYDADYKSAISGLESFAEKYLKRGGLVIDIGTSKSKNHMPILLKPYGLALNHTNYGSGSFTFTANEINFNSYKIKLVVPEEVSCTSNNVAGSDFNLIIEVFGNSGTTCDLNQAINASASSEYSINNGSVIVNLTNRVLRVESSIEETEVEFKIEMDNFSGKEPMAYLSDTLSVASRGLPISKTEQIRLA